MRTRVAILVSIAITLAAFNVLRAYGQVAGSYCVSNMIGASCDDGELSPMQAGGSCRSDFEHGMNSAQWCQNGPPCIDATVATRLLITYVSTIPKTIPPMLTSVLILATQWIVAITGLRLVSSMEGCVVVRQDLGIILMAVAHFWCAPRMRSFHTRMCACDLG